MITGTVDRRNCLPASTMLAAHQRSAIVSFCQFLTLPDVVPTNFDHAPDAYLKLYL
jgi:hypothetical protein